MIAIETIHASLFALGSGLASFKTTGRKLKAFNNIPKEMQPALFQVQHGFTPEQKDGSPSRLRIHVSWVIYVNTGEGDDASPSTTLNGILASVLAALEPTPSGGRQTLGGTVRHVRVAGDIEIDEALLGGQAMAVVPIEVLTERDWTVQPT